MRATTIMLLAAGLLVAGHWAHNEPSVTPKIAIEMAFAILVIAALDQGQTEPVAQGFAWLFLLAVLLGNKSILTGLAKVK